MAKRANIPEKSGTVHEGGAAKPGHNGLDNDKVQSFVDAYEEEQSLIDEIMTEAREKCQQHKDNQKDIKGEAADNNIPKKVFSAAISKRRLLARAEKVDAALNDAQKETFVQVQHALGMIADTPLGQAVLAKTSEKIAEKAYDHGYAAAATSGEKGVNIPTNPYPEGSDQHNEWQAGFLARQSEIAAEMAPETAEAAA